MDERIIFSQACLQEGIEYLSNKDKYLFDLFKKVGPLKLRLRAPGFSNLVAAIVSQQISVAAANAILKKMGLEMMNSEEMVMMSTDAQLKIIGLSRQKIKYIRSLAEARLNYDEMESLGKHEVIKILTEVKGIGRWTAEIYLMFSLGRADIFAAGDLALQEGCKSLYNLPNRPSEIEMRELAVQWKPWRAVAARGLWAFYSHIKKREGIR